MHFVEDTSSWLSAKTVWKSMQMRALGVVLKTGTKSIFRTLPIHLTCKTSVSRKIHEIMQVMFCLIFLPFYWASVKTVKCIIQRTSSSDTLRKPFEKSCRCAHLPTAWVGAHYLTHSLTHWVRSLTTTRSSSSYLVLRCYLHYLDIPDSESVYFLSINSCSARAKLYVYFVRVHAISKMCFCTVFAQWAVEILNRAGRGAHFIHSEKCTCTDSCTDSSRAPYLRSTS